MKPFFSIVIVNYNSGKYLEQAIQSIIKQSFSNWELIIIDGLSSDNSIDVIKKYENYCSWWVSEPDKGQSDAFNKGFRHAKGVFYTWLNADDLLLPGTLEYIYNYIKQHSKEKWVAVNTIYFDANNKILNCSMGSSHCNFILKHGVLTEVAPSTFFHSDLFAESNGFNVNSHYVMDTDLWIQFVNNGHYYKRINKFGWGFRMHDQSKTAESIVTKNSTTKQILEYEDMLTRNKVLQYGWVMFLQKIIRIFYSRPISLLFTLYYKDRDISEI